MNPKEYTDKLKAAFSDLCDDIDHLSNSSYYNEVVLLRAVAEAAEIVTIAYKKSWSKEMRNLVAVIAAWRELK